MVIGGLQKLFLSDFPRVISAILFTRGCSFRCPYCHNPELVDPPRFCAPIPMSDVRSFLSSRTGRIEGVVVTGGEPTFHADLPDLLAEIKSMDFRVKLDTNGSNPEMLRGILSDQLVDFVAMDIKAPLQAYEKIARVPVPGSTIQASIDLVLRSDLPHEFRTTFVGPLLTLDDLSSIADLVRGCRRYVIQTFRGDTTLDPGLAGSPAPSRADLEAAAARVASAGVAVEIR